MVQAQRTTDLVTFMDVVKNASDKKRFVILNELFHAVFSSQWSVRSMK